MSEGGKEKVEREKKEIEREREWSKTQGEPE